jgi:nicotinamidase-related amidase
VSAVVEPHPTVHLLIDMVNPLDFRGAERLFPAALAAARQIRALKNRLRAAAVPTVYVNDNFGHWELGFRELVAHYRRPGTRAAALLEHIAPEPGDHFILKPKHSAFYATSLEVLLARWGARQLILTGIAANICVLFTADDAHMRDYKLIVPADCVASEEPEATDWTLRQLRTVMDADVRPAAALDCAQLATADAPPGDDAQRS